MINTSNGTNGYTKSYSRTYVNNNGTGYIKEESMENDGKGAPKVKSFYRKIENGKYVEDPSKSYQKMIEQ
jgi:translation elongation factor P/translation initiation factor 5A